MLLPNRIAQGVRDGTITLAFRRWEEPRVKIGGTQLTSAGIVRFEGVEEVLDPSELTESDARSAGSRDVEALRRQLWPPSSPEPSVSFPELVEGFPGPEGSFPELVEGFPESGGSFPELVEGSVATTGGFDRLSQRPRRGPRPSRGGDHVYRVHLSWVGDDPRVALRDAIPDAAELAEVTRAVARLDAGKHTGPWTRPILEWIRDNPGVISTELAALLGRKVAPMKADIRRLKALGLTESLRVGYRLSPRGVAYLESLG